MLMVRHFKIRLLFYVFIVYFNNRFYAISTSGYIATSESIKKCILQEVANYFMNK